MDELSKKWEDLSDIAQATIIELVAGKHQGNVFASLMSNFDVARSALETSINSSGSAMAEHAKWSESLEARLNKLKSAWQSLSQSFMSSDFLKGVLDVIINLVNWADKLIDTFGTIPTLLGLFAGGMSLFNKKGIFSFDKDSKSLQIFKKNISDLKTDFGKLQVAVDRYNSASSKSVSFQEKYNKAMSNSSSSIGKYLSGLNGAKASIGGYITHLAGAAIKTVALEAATMALNAALTMGVSALISAGIKLLDEWIVTADELADKVDEVVSKFNDQQGELVKGKSSFESQANRYGELAKGVDRLGRNMSLTADEYSEYQSISNSIADQIPSLVSGFDKQGNAILNYRGNVEDLTRAYENLIKAQNNEVLMNAGDIDKDFKNVVKDAKSFNDGFLGMGVKLSTESAKVFKNILDGKTSVDEALYNANNGKSGDRLVGQDLAALANELEDAGFKRNGGFWNPETDEAYVKRAFKENKAIVKRAIDDFYSDLEKETAGKKSIAQAVLSDAFDISSSDYYEMSDTLQGIARQIVNGFDFEFFAGLEDKGIGVEDYVNDMLDKLNAIGKNDIKSIEAAFDLQTKFNGGDISYGEYVKGLEDTGRLIDGLGLDEEIETQLKLGIGLNEDGIVAEYSKLLNRLTDHKNYDFDQHIQTSVAEQFLDSLSAEELSVAFDVIANLSDNGVEETIQDIRDAINRELAVQGLTFDLNLETESASLEAFNTALAESVSATGLSSESIAALKGRYKELESQGYDLSAMFEETSNGIHLNKKAVGELEKAYAEQKQADITKDLEALKKEYNSVTKEINECNDSSERAALYVQRDAIIQQINDAATLASQYKGLTSAYNDWLKAEEAGQERDMYENVIEGLETIDDEISRGWLDDGTIEFLELLTGENLSTAGIDDQIAAYKRLKTTIDNTSYSIRDFFTVDKDGNSTNAGVYNFLDAIGQMEEEKFLDKDGKPIDVVKRKNGKIIGFDFSLVAEKDENGNVIKNGDQVIAEALGISEELVQIMLRAADDAGFVVNLEGAYTQLADLKTEAESARDTLISLKKNGLEKLKDVDVNFNLDAEGNDLVKEQEKAVKLLDKFKKDGKIDLTMEGAQQALDIAEYLTIRLDDLTEPRFMQIDTSEVEENLRDPIEKIQDIGNLCKEKHLLTLTGDTEELKEVQSEIDKTAKEIEKLDPEVKAQIGIDENWTAEEIADAIEKGEIEIPASLELDVQMSDDLKDMRLMMMNQLGLVSDEEVKLKVGFDIDESIVNSLTGEQQKVVLEYIVANEDEFNKLTEDEKEVLIKYIAENEDEFNKLTEDDKKVLIKYIADGGDVEKFNAELEREKNIKVIAETFGEKDVEGLSKALEGVDSTKVQAVAEALGKKDVDALNTAIDGMEDNEATALAHALGYEDVESLKTAIADMKGNEVDASVNTDGQADKISTLQSEIDGLKGKNVFINVIKTFFERVASSGANKANQRTGADPAGNGVGGVNGTANVNGTAGRAFKQGTWGTKNSGTALVGELGAETLVRDGRYYTIGNNGAEFINYKKGDIIFNHIQTRELFENGKVTSGNGRARAFASGTAFALGGAGRTNVMMSDGGGSGGNGGIGRVDVKRELQQISKKAAELARKTENSGSGGTGGYEKDGGTSVGSGTSSSSSSSSYKEEKEFKETFDWIEVAIDRIERAIDTLDIKASSVYRSWSERNDALSGEISKVGDEISLQQKAYDRYIQQANSVGLSESWAKLVRDGEIDINTITDEDLAEKIGEYQTWYNKAIDCKKAIEDLKETESGLYAQRFENIQTQYDSILQGYEHTESMLNEYISQAEAKGHIVSKQYYQALIDNEKQNIAQLEKEQADLIASRDEAVAAGKIVEGSEKWYDMCAEIDGVTQAIEEANTALIEYDNSMRDVDWSVFDLMQERISAVTEEADFLIELMSNEKLFDDDGKLTSQGLATMGLYAQNYNANMYQADEYGAEIASLNEDIAKDPYDQELINRRNELLELQRESILAAEEEKNAVKDMVEEGIELELDALNERIDKYKEALDSQKDLYDYQKNVKEQTEEIASLEKQMAAYSGDDSEEARQKVQQIKVDLENAKEDLQETEYDKYISDQQQLLDVLYDEYELILNQRLDNVDYLLEQVIESINAVAGADSEVMTALGAEGAISVAIANNATSVKTTLETEAKNVGTTLSTAMDKIWSVGEGNAKSVLTMYGEDFRTKSTTINTTLNGIKVDVSNMLKSIDKDAASKTSSNKTSSSSKKNPTSNNKTTTNQKKSTSSGDGKPKVGDKVTFVSGQYYYDSQGKKPLGSKYKGKQVYITNINNKDWATHGYHISTGKKLGDGDLGWLKLSQISGYASGKQNFLDDEIAWTQENGKEFIVRPSDGAILTPVAKGDSVLNAVASGNIWNMANNPSEFIKDNLKLDDVNIPNNPNTQNNYTQHLDKVIFNMPNVKNYEEFLSAMQRDKNFEKLIHSMTVDRLAGKSSLAKGKSIR